MKLIISKIPDGYPKPDVDNITLYRAGQSAENPFGYSGQLALREQLRMTKSVQQVLKMDPSQITTELIEDKAIEDGMLTMLQDGILKVCSGITSIEEVYRVVDY